jgi:ion channel POLLUX/CASTOR
LIIDVIVRTGVPHLQSDLKKVSASSARSVIVLADKNASLNTDMADVNTVRTVLGLHGMGAPSNGHIVAEILDVDNEPLVNIVGKDSVETFVSHDIIGRLMIQCARERGLAQVLEQLLGFQGCEFYIKEWPCLTGMSFGEVMFRFADAIVVGVMRGSGAKESVTTMLNPPKDLVVQEGDYIIVVAEDDDSYEPSEKGLYDDTRLDGLVASLRTPFRSRRKHPERLLFVGWRRDVEDMISELDSYVCEGSELTLFNQLDLKTREVCIV